MKLAIKGHATRGKEVIQLLEMLGGKSNSNMNGYNDDLYYFIAKDGLIYGSDIEYEELNCKYTIFTLEEFLEKFPYKVGDKVTLDNKLCSIKWMCWECNNIYYQVQGIDTMFTKKVIVNDLQPYKEETNMNKTLAIKGHETRGKEVIQLLEMLGGVNYFKLNGIENDSFYYIRKDNNKIHLCSCTSVENVSVENVIFYTLEEFLEKFPYKVGDKVQHKGATSCGSIFEVEDMRWEEYTVKYTLCLFGCNYKRSTLPAEYLQPYKEETMEEKGTLVQIDLTREMNVNDEVEVILGDYEFVLKDGKTYFIKNKPRYPKDYEECCEVLGILDNRGFGFINLSECENILMSRFIQLKRCRDAYWKIAGKQLGLDKHWEPDWNNGHVEKYYIYLKQNEINNKSSCFFDCHFLSFPTKEMRDAFCENFKDLINDCKELL